MTRIVTKPIEMVLNNTTENINITVTDDDGNAVLPTALSVRIRNGTGDDLVTSTILPSPSVDNLIVYSGTTGKYYFPFGDDGTVTANTTANSGDFMFIWSATYGGVSASQTVQVVKVVTEKTLRMLPYFRFLVDKSHKLVDDDPEDPIYLGYTDIQLVECLENGLTLINAGPFTLGWSGIDDFPETHRAVLLDAALFYAIAAQVIYSIDTDLSPGGWSDQGQSFVIQHQPQLAQFLDSLAARLKESIKLMKFQYISNGSIHISAGPNYRFNALLEAAPNGALFRGIFST